MKIYTSTVDHIKSNGDAVLNLPPKMCHDYGIKPGDRFTIHMSGKSVVMKPYVNYSRLRREWNKYMRRVENHTLSFEVFRANRKIGTLKPPGDTKYITEFFVRPRNST